MTNEVEEAEIMEAETIEASNVGQLLRQERGLTPQSDERSVDEVVAQMQKVKQLMMSVLVKDEHYGIIPGTDKPTLLQPGAQKLCFMFRLVPKFNVDERNLEGGHREYIVRCLLFHSTTGQKIGEGVGSCSTMESKYRWRKADRVCPECGGDFIKRSKFDDKGWYCYAKIGGCGAKYGADDPAIVSQETGKKENPDIADAYNTALKMAKKRSFVDATLTATAASDCYTQDLDDMPEFVAGQEPQTTRSKAASPKQKAAPQQKKDGISKEQAAALFTAASDRGEETGFTREQIMRDVLQSMKLERTTDIASADYDEALKLVREWDPKIEVEAEQGGSE
jgi:hypothetical protein